MTPRATYKEIRSILIQLAKAGLSDDQEFPIYRGRTEITFANAHLVSQAMKDIQYVDVYDAFRRNRVFNVKLLDGALLQMTYTFDGRELVKHRLAFLSSPHLVPFDEDPWRYLEDEMFGEIVARRVDSVSLRFDYYRSEHRHQDVIHPKSHLTVGGYECCRIPVSSPLTPLAFVRFILQNFYRTTTKDFAADLPRSRSAFPRSITRKEEGIPHLVVPG